MNNLGIALISVAALGCAGPTSPTGDDTGTGGANTMLSDAERTRLAFTREEEKLARDVYIALDAYGLPFTNIQISEQRHFDAVGSLLVTYGLPDPAAGRGVGELTDPDLQALYVDLVGRGSPSLMAALTVGLVIEDLDLRDLAVAIEETSHPDIALVYDNLSRGSRNHLRAFYGQLVAVGGSYTPQYIDQATFDAIVSSARERGGWR